MFYRLQQVLAILTSIGAYVMVVLGAIVTKTASGKGCGASWPFCQGQLFPDALSQEGFIEYSHRIASGIDGALIVALTLVTWFSFKKNRQIRFFGLSSVFFVLLQGTLGALTVLYEHTYAKDFLLAFHFGFSLLSFASVILLTITLFQSKGERSGTGLAPAAASPLQRFFVWGLAVYAYLVVYSGSLVRHMNATMGCGHEFPSCGTTFFPGFDSPAGVQMFHRYAAISLWVLTLVFLLISFTRRKQHPDVFWSSLLAFVLICVQAGSGISTVFLDGQLVIALVHTTCIVIYFSVISYICLRVGFPLKKQVESSPSVQQA